MLYICLVFYCFSSKRIKTWFSWPLLRTCCHQPWRLDSVAHPARALSTGSALAYGPANTAFCRGFCCTISTAKMVLITPASATHWLLSQKLLCVHILVVKKAGKPISESFSFFRERQSLLLTETQIINTTISEDGLDAHMPTCGKHSLKEPLCHN